MKKCATCQETKPIQTFSRNAHQRDGLQKQCRPCRAEASRKWWRSLPPERRTVHQRTQRLKSFGITAEQFDDLLGRQSGVCAICKQTQRGEKMLCIDHDHETGAVRGLLCTPCNAAVGLLGDDVNRLRAALDYLATELETPPAP